MQEGSFDPARLNCLVGAFETEQARRYKKWACDDTNESKRKDLETLRRRVDEKRKAPDSRTSYFSVVADNPHDDSHAKEDVKVAPILLRTEHTAALEALKALSEQLFCNEKKVVVLNPPHDPIPRLVLDSPASSSSVESHHMLHRTESDDGDDGSVSTGSHYASLRKPESSKEASLVFGRRLICLGLAMVAVSLLGPSLLSLTVATTHKDYTSSVAVISSLSRRIFQDSPFAVVESASLHGILLDSDDDNDDDLLGTPGTEGNIPGICLWRDRKEIISTENTTDARAAEGWIVSDDPIGRDTSLSDPPIPEDKTEAAGHADADRRTGEAFIIDTTAIGKESEQPTLEWALIVESMLWIHHRERMEHFLQQQLQQQQQLKAQKLEAQRLRVLELQQQLEVQRLETHSLWAQQQLDARQLETRAADALRAQRPHLWGRLRPILGAAVNAVATQIDVVHQRSTAGGLHIPDVLGDVWE